jgi:hypothetical protein
MATITTDLGGNTIIMMSDGLELRIPDLNSASSVNPQDIRNVYMTLFSLVDILDKRIAVLEKSTN